MLAASWQDRDGAKTALLGVYLATPIRYVFADQGFAGRLVEWAKRTLHMVIDIVRKPAAQRGFAVHPKRWVVERTLAWLTAHRRLARDYERDPSVSEEMIRWAAISQMLRPHHPRQTRPSAATPNPTTSPSHTPLKHPLRDRTGAQRA